jgi:hypothetical protein
MDGLYGAEVLRGDRGTNYRPQIMDENEPAVKNFISEIKNPLEGGFFLVVGL